MLPVPMLAKPVVDSDGKIVVGAERVEYVCTEAARAVAAEEDAQRLSHRAAAPRRPDVRRPAPVLPPPPSRSTVPLVNLWIPVCIISFYSMQMTLPRSSTSSPQPRLHSTVYAVRTVHEAKNEVGF